MSKIDTKNIFEVLGKYILVDGFHVAIDLEKSKGNYFIDPITGKKYLDCYSYFASLPIGHNHPKMLDAEFLEKLKWAAISNPANSDIYCKDLAESIDTFGKLAMPSDFANMFFVAGGGLAVENCLKIAFDWKVQKNFAKGIKEEKGHKIIHFKEAFHGRTGYTMSLTNTDPTKTNYFPKFNWPRIQNPKLSFPVTPEVLYDVEEMEKKAIDQIMAEIKNDSASLAALIIEPIQGEGGDNHFRPEFFKALSEICKKNEILFICDEVQSGMGITGKMWAYEHMGIVPDLIAFGKKAQVCGVMAGKRIHEVKNNVFKVSSRINSTWGGNLVDFVRGAKYLEIMKEENLVENAAKVGKYFLNQLMEELFDGKKVTNVRGKGFFIAFDLPTTQDRNDLRQKAWNNGFATLASGTRSIRFRPSLTFTKNDVDLAIKILKDCL